MANAETEEGNAPLIGSFGTVVLVVALLAGLFILPRIFKRHESPMVGTAGPGFDLPVITNALEPGGTSLKLESLKGRPVILDFWASWCPPCKAEMPILDSLATRHKEQGLVVLGIDTNDGEDPARSWVRSHGIAYPILLDDQATSQAYGVQNLPTLVVLDRAGKVVAVRVGLTDSSELETILRDVL